MRFIMLLSLLIFVPKNHQIPHAHPKETFDFEAIHPTSPSGAVKVKFDPNDCIIAGLPLRFVILYAFDIHDYQLLNAPAWVNSTRYDIEGKVLDEMGDADQSGEPDKNIGKADILRERLRDMLSRRFGLKSTSAQVVRPVYALSVVKQGTKMTVSTGPRRYSLGPGQLSAENLDMGQLADLLSGATDRVVLDETGLSAVYSFNLHFAPNDSTTDIPSLFTALQEQLGLRLLPKKDLVNVVTISQIHEPTAN